MLAGGRFTAGTLWQIENRKSLEWKLPSIV